MQLRTTSFLFVTKLSRSMCYLYMRRPLTCKPSSDWNSKCQKTLGIADQPTTGHKNVLVRKQISSAQISFFFIQPHSSAPLDQYMHTHPGHTLCWRIPISSYKSFYCCLWPWIITNNFPHVPGIWIPKALRNQRWAPLQHTAAEAALVDGGTEICPIRRSLWQRLSRPLTTTQCVCRQAWLYHHPPSIADVRWSSKLCILLFRSLFAYI